MSGLCHSLRVFCRRYSATNEDIEGACQKQYEMENTETERAIVTQDPRRT